MYKHIKSMVHVQGQSSGCFLSNIGLRQGENLSPVLFSIFVNDLEASLIESGCQGISSPFENEDLWVQLLVLLYADDTILLADSASALQKNLDMLVAYCKRWKLVINISKTKAIVFEKRKSIRQPVFNIDGVLIETVSEFKYLGVLFNYTGNFAKCKKLICEHAKKALIFVLKKVQHFSLDFDTAFQVFDAMVGSILTFGCEVWGFGNFDVIEKIHLTFCKYLLSLKRSTPNLMIYGETGRFPFEIRIKVRMVKFWGHLILHEETYSGKMYRILYNSHLNGSQSKWISCIESILQNCGLGNIWLEQTFPNIPYLGELVKLRLEDQFKQTWHGSMVLSSKLDTYRIFKTDWGQEKYLSSLPRSLRISLCRFRCSNHKLPIETGRYENKPRNERVCNKCNENTIGDEYHFILKCEFFNAFRILYIPNRYRIGANQYKFKQLLSNENLYYSLSKYITTATRLL
ncbi:uncharacterized protein LOC141914230 [Tubulanus polymorphus]|uniref:uncharacterized protein LOC141914230 n=1 Tax=Tubulanus polymorphus TaxID=672921 RepID=UPI003DA5AAE5